MYLSRVSRNGPLRLAMIATIALAGCHSAHIDATVSNRTAKPISLVQVEYPSASFGTQTLASGQDFKYRFKVLGSGPVKLSYTDAGNTEHKSTGPTLDEGSQGTLAIAVSDSGVAWDRTGSANTASVHPVATEPAR